MAYAVVLDADVLHPYNLADLLQVTGHPDEAMEHLTRAVTLFAEVGGRPGELEPEIWKLVDW